MLERGARYRIDFTAANFDQIVGFQYTLEYDSEIIRVVDIDYGDTLGLDESNFAINSSSTGIITTSWDALKRGLEYVDGISVDPAQILFTLVVEAKHKSQLSEILAISGKETKAEAYSSNMAKQQVSLFFENDQITSEHFALYQNRPNPFRVETVIGFYLPEAMSARLTFYDVTGKLLKIVEKVYSKGDQEERISQKDLNTHGVIYYQLDTKNYSASRQMILSP
jgi:hypothetical protein